MSRLSVLCFGLVVGLCVGLWFGINIGHDRPLLTNPLVGNTLSGE